MIIAAYPCIGKSTITKKFPNKYVDFESSNFEKVEGWEEKYITKAREISNKRNKIVFVSTHSGVIKQLINDQNAVIIYPSVTNNYEFLERAANRYQYDRSLKNLNAYNRIHDYFFEDIRNLEKMLKNAKCKKIKISNFEVDYNLDDLINNIA